MAGTALITSELSAADLAAVDGEPRVMDLRLAEVLGFDRTRNIRKLIQRHIETLKAFGEVCSMWSKPAATGGRPAKSYWLNKRQALFVTAKSDTERAALVTVELVEVYDAVTRGVVPAITQTAPARRPTPSKGIGVVKLDRIIWFDTKRRPDIGELALVVRHNGALGVYPVVRSERQPEEGYVYVEDKKPEPWQISVRSRVSLIGAVITAAGKARRASKRIGVPA